MRSPVARAVVPVLAGLAVLIAVFGLLWLIAVVVTRNADETDRRIGADVFEVGRVDRLADSVARDGPILFPNLAGPAGRRPVGLTHDGPNDFEGWRVFSLRPAGEEPSCLVSVDRTTKELQDCHGRVVSVGLLPPAERVEIVIDPDGTLTLDLQPDD
jgi:hypothetical protein